MFKREWQKYTKEDKKFFKRIVLVCSVTIILAFIGLFCKFVNNNICFILFSGLAAFIVLSYVIAFSIISKIKEIRNPYLGPTLAEIKHLKEFLELKKQIINNLFFIKKKSVFQIAKELEQEYQIQLHHQGGSKEGQLISEFYLKIIEVLGFKNEQKYREYFKEFKYGSKIREYKLN